MDNDIILELPYDQSSCLRECTPTPSIPYLVSMPPESHTFESFIFQVSPWGPPALSSSPSACPHSTPQSIRWISYSYCPYTHIYPPNILTPVAWPCYWPRCGRARRRPARPGAASASFAVRALFWRGRPRSCPGRGPCCRSHAAANTACSAHGLRWSSLWCRRYSMSRFSCGFESLSHIAKRNCVKECSRSNSKGLSTLHV